MVKKNSNIRAQDWLEKQFGKLTFGKMVQGIRKCNEMTQEQLATALGVSKQYICKVEKGERLVSVDQAAKFAEILEHSVDYFVLIALQDQIVKAGLRTKLKIA